MPTSARFAWITWAAEVCSVLFRMSRREREVADAGLLEQRLRALDVALGRRDVAVPGRPGAMIPVERSATPK